MSYVFRLINPVYDIDMHICKVTIHKTGGI